MRFLSLYRSPEGVPPTPEKMAAMGALIDTWTKAGVLLSAEGCRPSAMGMRIRQTAGTHAVTDGPFTESKEVIGGVALIQADTKEHAIELIKEFLRVAGDGECEVRPLY